MKIFLIASEKTQGDASFVEKVRDLYIEFFGLEGIDENNTINCASKKRGNLTDEQYIKTCLSLISSADRIIHFIRSREVFTEDAITIQLLYARLLKKPVSVRYMQ